MLSETTRRQQTIALALVVGLLAATVAPASVAVAAQSDAEEESLAGEIVSAATDEGSVIQPALGFASGLADRVLAVGGPDTDASTACGDLRTTIADHSGTLQDYANDRVDAAASADVLEIECAIGDASSTIYVTADVNGSAYANTSAVNTTDRTVDESCTLDDDAAANASAELQHFVDAYIEGNETIPRSEYARLAGRYGGAVECSFALEE